MISDELRMVIRLYLSDARETQGEFARKLKIHRVSLARYLNGESDLAGTKVLAILDALGLEIVGSNISEIDSEEQHKLEREKMKSGMGAYGEVKQLVASIDEYSTMKFEARGHGGNWVICACNKKLIIEVPSTSVANDLDRLYEPLEGIELPVSCDDYSNKLLPNAQRLILDLIDTKGQ